LFVPGGISEIFYRVRDSFLRWVAKRHDIHVPSLVADSLIRADEQPDDVITEAERHAELVAITEHVPDDEAIGCPVCGARIAVAAAKDHEHFTLADAGVSS